MQQHSQEPVSTLLYRIESLERDLTQFKSQYANTQTAVQSIATIEREMVQLKTQLNGYVPARENDLRMQNINDTVQRIESELMKVKDRLETMNTHMASQDKDMQTKDAAQRESQDKLQIRVLWFIVSTIVVILSGVLIAFLTHLI